MQRIVNYLQKEKCIDLSKLDAVEVFARTGDWVAKYYSDLVRSLEAWEIQKKYLDSLKKNLPNAIIRNVDSIKYMDICKNKFNLINIDNPQGIYGNNYCEIFDVLEKINRIIIPTSTSVVIFLVNQNPYNVRNVNMIFNDNYGMNDELFKTWYRRREKFYKINDASKLPDKFVYQFYFHFFDKLGFKYILNKKVFVKIKYS